MKSVDREGLNHGTLVSYAIAMALFDELVGPDKMRVAQKALSYLPPCPPASQGTPVDVKMWQDAEKALKALGGM